jgi:2-dehydro-3-deoxyphosphooctonate aldolase (KDO 8-P synthase)
MRVHIGGDGVPAVQVGGGAPLVLIAGPCVIESRAHALGVAEALRDAGRRHRLPVIYKSSFDKANRSALDGPRGPGLAEGLAILRAVRAGFGLPVTTDVHDPSQAAEAAAAGVDLLQVPAFLCRQTDLLLACAATGRPVNWKKGQFMAPFQVGAAVDKLQRGGCPGVIVTERGTTFGHGDLVVDYRGLHALRAEGHTICFDATHSVQRPGALGVASGGERRYVPALARAAVAVGVDALFLEVHPDPSSAPSDGANMVPLHALDALLHGICAVDAAARAAPAVGGLG